MNKFKLTTKKKQYFGTVLFQIEALKDFGNVSKGDKGGWIEKEENLSQDGNAWVYGDARVSDNARVYGDAWVSGKLKITLGHFFGYKEKKEDLKYFDNNEDYQLIGKGDCEVEEIKEEEKDFTLSNGAKVSEQTVREALEYVAKNK